MNCPLSKNGKNIEYIRVTIYQSAKIYGKNIIETQQF